MKQFAECSRGVAELIGNLLDRVIMTVPREGNNEQERVPGHDQCDRQTKQKYRVDRARQIDADEVSPTTTMLADEAYARDPVAEGSLKILRR